MTSEILDRTPTGFSKWKTKSADHIWRAVCRSPDGRFCTTRSYTASARYFAKADKKVYDADKKKWGIKKPQTILDIWKPTRDKLKIPSLKTGSPPFYRKSKYGKKLHRQDTLQPITACNRRCSNWDYADGPETCKHCLKSIPAGEM